MKTSGCLNFWGAAVMVLFFVLSACSSSEPVKVGFIGGLTGHYAALGKAGRDGALLAVEETNAQGGLNGRRIELSAIDNKLDEEQCREAIAELAAQKVVGIVGPMTSAMALIVVPVINEHSIPTVSPTVSTGLLAGKDDFFFRIIPVSSNAAFKTAEYAYNEKKYKRLLVIYDKSNSGYTFPWLNNLKTHFENFTDGEIQDIGFSSKSGYDFLELAKVIAKKEMDCLVLLANSLDTALLSQQLAKIGLKIPILASEWSLNDELIEFGGKAVEGISLFHSFDPNSNKQSNLDFNVKFQKRFGYAAGFASVYGYNAMKILLGSLEEGASAEQVKKNILNGSPYAGVQCEIRINGFGDALRDYSLLKIQDGKIITI